MTQEWRELFDTMASRRNAPAVVAGGCTVGWNELAELIASHGDDFLREGVVPRSRVALVSENSLDCVVRYLALLYCEAVPILISPRFPEALRNAVKYETDVSIAMPMPAPEGRNETIVFTSGTTGTPRAAQLSLLALIENARGANANLPFDLGDRWLLSLPLYHVGGLGILFRTLVCGGTIVISEKEEPLGAATARYGCTHLSIVPTQLRRLCREISEPSVTTPYRAVLVGGAQLPDTVASEALDLGLPIYVTYGLTEMGSQVCTRRLTVTSPEVRNVGCPLAGREVMIDPRGVILVRGATLFDGYYQRGGTIDSARSSDGWFRTNDLGRLLGDGSLVVLGRVDNCLISGGENIHAEEIERVLLAVDGIESAVVVSVPDNEYGERPVAFLKWAGTPALSLIKTALDQLLPKFKHPDHFFEWPSDIPLVGIKPPRSVLRERARELTPKKY